MRRTLALATAAAATVGVLAVTSCSSSGSSSATVSGGVTSSSSANSNSDWLVGSIIDETGSSAPQYDTTPGVLQAWVKAVNNGGGIDGHRLRLVIEDSESSPSAGLQAANELISDHVIALVQGGSSVASSFASAIDKADIPVICGAPAAAPPYGIDKNFYPCVPGAASETDLIVKAAVGRGDKKIGVISCVESSACTAAAQAMEASAKKFGATVVTQSVSFSSPSFTPACLAMKSAGVQALFPLGPSTVVSSIVQQCGEQNYKPTYIGDTLTKGWLNNPNISGFIGLSENFPYFGDSAVATNFRKVMEKYDPAALQSNQDTNATIWATALLFEAAAKAGNLGDNPTPAEVIAGLDKLSNETLGGASAPLTFTSGNRTVSCGFEVGVANGQFIAPDGDKPICDNA